MTPASHFPARKSRVENLVLGYAALLFGILVSAFLVLGDPHLGAGIMGMGILVIVGLVVSRMELLHPFTWYLPLFFLYSASVPSLVWVGIRNNIGSLHEIIVLQWLAMAAFMLTVGPGGGRQTRSVAANLSVTKPAQLLFIAALALSALYIYGVVSSGLTTKFAIALSSSPLLRFNAAFSILTFTFAILVADAFRKGRLPWFLVCGTLAWMALAFVYTGERALVFRTFWVTLIVTHAIYIRISPKMLLLIGAAALALVTALAEYKARHLSEFEYTSGEFAFDAPSLVQIVFADEFVTASENLQVLVEESPWPFYRGETLWWDLRQVVQIGERRSGPSPTAFFNNFFFPRYVEQGGGRGFTLVGEGYMNFGRAGAVLWFVILGVFVRFLYLRSRRNILWLAVYATTMPLVVYSTRADFSNLLSPFLKHVLGPIAVILILRAILHPRPGKHLVALDNSVRKVSESTTTPMRNDHRA